MYPASTHPFTARRSVTRRLGEQILGIAFTLGIASSASADYPQTLAAQGADAFAPANTVVSIDQQDIAEAFSSTALLAKPALSDQEVMVDLHTRINSADHLLLAAANLDPLAVTDATTPTADAATEQEPAIASR